MVLSSTYEDGQSNTYSMTNQSSVESMRYSPSTVNKQDQKQLEREVIGSVNDKGKAEEGRGMTAVQMVPPKESSLPTRALLPRADVEDMSRILERFFDYDRILAEASETQTFVEMDAMEHLQSWTAMEKSGFMGVQGPASWMSESPTQLIASHYVQAARMAGLPCISYFCSLSHEVPPEGRLRETIGLVALLYSFLKQMISHLPLQLDHQATMFQKTRFNNLDGTLRTWQDALSLFDDLLQCAEPPFMLCVIHGLESLEHQATQDALQSFMKVLRNHTEDQERAESRVFKVLFTTAGLSQTIAAALREDELLDINRGNVASSPGRAKKGRISVSNISFA